VSAPAAGAGEGEPTLLVVGATGQVGYELVRELAPLGRVVAFTRADCDLGDPAAAGGRGARGAARGRGERRGVHGRRPRRAGARRGAAGQRRGARRDGRGRGECGAPFVHYSTDYVFDGAKDGPYVEADATNPLGVYGRTKLDGERAVAAANPAHLVFRTSWVYGARGQNFARTMLRLAREREELRVVADQVGAPTWARAIAAATAQVVGAALRAGRGAQAWTAEHAGVYHLASAGETSWHGFAEAVLAADPARDEQRARRVVPIATTDFPTPARRPANSRLDSGRAAERLGVRIPDWRDQLRLALAP
jgi:dTDP-4-dehydrorhamnose reductase